MFPLQEMESSSKIYFKAYNADKASTFTSPLDCNYAHLTLSTVKLETLRVLEARNPNKKAVSQNS